MDRTRGWLGRAGVRLNSEQNVRRGRAVARAVGTAAVAALAGISVLSGDRRLGGKRERLSERNEGDGGVRVRQVVRVQRSVAECYAYWRDLPNLPRFMPGMESVELLDGGRSRWRMRGPTGTLLTWDDEITEDQPNELLAWHSLPDTAETHAPIASRGIVRFAEGPAGRGTQVTLELHYTPPAELTVARVLGFDPSDQAREGLRAFRQLLETGEIPRVTFGMDARGIRPMPLREIHEAAVRARAAERRPVPTEAAIPVPGTPVPGARVPSPPLEAATPVPGAPAAKSPRAARANQPSQPSQPEGQPAPKKGRILEETS